MEEGLRRRGIAVSDDQLRSMLGELDANKDRKVSASEFDAFCDKRRANIKQVFRDVDADGDGQIDSKELRRGVERAGLKISDEQLRAAPAGARRQRATRERALGSRGQAQERVRARRGRGRRDDQAAPAPARSGRGL